jgi:hypothetical protein
MAVKDITVDMFRKGFICIMTEDPDPGDFDTDIWGVLFQHEATRLSCVTVEPGRYNHVPIHSSVYHWAETLDEAIAKAAEAAMRPVPTHEDEA